MTKPEQPQPPRLTPALVSPILQVPPAPGAHLQPGSTFNVPWPPEPVIKDVHPPAVRLECSPAPQNQPQDGSSALSSFSAFGCKSPEGLGKGKAVWLLIVKRQVGKTFPTFYSLLCPFPWHPQSQFLDFNLQHVVYYCCFSLNSNICQAMQWLHPSSAAGVYLLSPGEELMDIDPGSCVTFTVSLRVWGRGCKIVSSHFDFITNQNTSHSMASHVHRIITLGEQTTTQISTP